MSRVAVDLVSRSLLCFGIAAAVGGILHSDGFASAVSPCGEISYLGAHGHEAVVFGLVNDMGDVSPADLIPLVPGQQFGWDMELNDNGLHTWREVLITPRAPRDWIGADLTIVHGGRIGITERTEVAVGGTLQHAWTITDGDPAGHHVLELWLDGRLVKRVPFVIARPF